MAEHNVWHDLGQMACWCSEYLLW